MNSPNIILVTLFCLICVFTIHSDNMIKIETTDVAAAEKILGLSFSDQERDQIFRDKKIARLAAVNARYLISGNTQRRFFS